MAMVDDENRLLLVKQETFVRPGDRGFEFVRFLEEHEYTYDGRRMTYVPVIDIEPNESLMELRQLRQLKGKCAGDAAKGEQIAALMVLAHVNKQDFLKEVKL